MTKHFNPLEIREEDPITAATAAVNELRTANEEFRTRMEGELRTRDERISQLEARANRPGNSNVDEQRAEKERREFRNWMTGGANSSASLDERRVTMNERCEVRTNYTVTGGDTSGAGGAYTVPPEFFAELIRNLVLVSPVRAIARVMAVGGPSVLLPKRTANVTASWETEVTPEPQTNPVFGQQTLSNQTLKAYVDVSQQALEDSFLDLGAELSFDLAQDFGRAEGAAFVSGSGSGQPEGFTVNATVLADYTMQTATASTLAADDLVNLLYSLPSFYANNATWVMSRQMQGIVRKMKDSENRYLWQQNSLQGISSGQSATLLGLPVVELPDMATAVADNALVIGLADWKNFYRITDRVGLQILRDPFSQATSNIVRFHGRRRVGGAVVLPEAGRLLQIKPAS